MYNSIFYVSPKSRPSFSDKVLNLDIRTSQAICITRSQLFSIESCRMESVIVDALLEKNVK